MTSELQNQSIALSNITKGDGVLKDLFRDLVFNDIVSDKTIEYIIRAIGELFEKWDLGVEFVVNPGFNKMREIAKRVDYVLDDHSISFLYEKEGVHMINTSIMFY